MLKQETISTNQGPLIPEYYVLTFLIISNTNYFPTCLFKHMVFVPL